MFLNHLVWRMFMKEYYRCLDWGISWIFLMYKVYIYKNFVWYTQKRSDWLYFNKYTSSNLYSGRELCLTVFMRFLCVGSCVFVRMELSLKIKHWVGCQQCKFILLLDYRKQQEKKWKAKCELRISDCIRNIPPVVVVHRTTEWKHSYKFRKNRKRLSHKACPCR